MGEGPGATIRETVCAPQAHEGLGRALRDAFAPRAELPEEMRGLLERLNR